jgi:type I restriction enzyme, S subunit
VIPEGWKQLTLASISTKIGDGIHATPKYDENGLFYFINGNNINEGNLTFSAFTKKVGQSEFEKYKLPLSHRTILMSINGTIGNLARYQGEAVVLGKSAAYINIREDFCENFAFHVLSAESTQNHFMSELTGSTIKNLSLKTIRNAPLIAPPLPEQQRIAEILSTWDRAIETVEALIASARAQKKALMQSLITGKHRLPGFSGEWTKQKLGNLCQISKGEQLGRLAMIETGSIPVINGGITASGYTDRANNPGDCITISEGGNSCGFVSMMDQPFWCGGHCYALKDLVTDRSFLFASLKHREIEIMTLRVGSGLPNIQKKALSGFELNMPPRAEQEAIGQFADTLDDVLAKLQSQLTAIRQEKSALMQQLLTGKRRVKVAESEAA